MYRAPVDDISYTFKHILALQNDLEQGTFGDLSEDLIDAILEEAGKFANEEIAPLNRLGDETGLTLQDASVSMPEGFGETYKRWCEAGWNGLIGSPDFGGQGLPIMMQVATGEFWNAANLSFSLCPLLTAGAIEALTLHGSDDLKKTYLEKLITGEWTGTMNLTEPQSGSDLSTLRSRAERTENGSYRIFGQKIYITYGEHDMADNICHLVLARLPDAPAGVKGISLFLVPKFLLDENGNLGQRNDVFCHSLEHKLGIHASPTCTMIFGDNHAVNETGQAGAVGYLIGDEHNGLACMFTMMNNARLNVGVQGAGIGERAYQHALNYANERKQGSTPDYNQDDMAPIVYHPDVTRNLMTMRALVQAARALCLSCAYALDMAAHAPEDERAFWQRRGDLLTPLAKAYSTDKAVEIASIGIQIHGGMGFIEETGAAQYLRDARILPIYEGTNGIQAIDLVGRKLRVDMGENAQALFQEIADFQKEISLQNDKDLSTLASSLADCLANLQEATDFMLTCLKEKEMDKALSGATPYQSLFATTLGLYYHARGTASLKTQDNVSPRDNLNIQTARFYAENIAPETNALKKAVLNSAETLLKARQHLIA